MLHCNFSLAAAQLLVKVTSALQKFSKANVAVQLLQRSVPKTATQLPFSVRGGDGMLQGWDLEGWGLGLADPTGPTLRAQRLNKFKILNFQARLKTVSRGNRALVIVL